MPHPASPTGWGVSKIVRARARIQDTAPKGIAEATDPGNQTRGSILKGHEHSTRLAHTSGIVTADPHSTRSTPHTRHRDGSIPKEHDRSACGPSL